MGAIFSIYSLPLIVAVIFAVMTIHEFAHGLTLKHHGGRVEEMGFMILYFIPAFYCNVSDAWMLKKRDRIRTTLAGGYIQVLIWALSTIGWRLLAPETPASRICSCPLRSTQSRVCSLQSSYTARRLLSPQRSY